MPRTLKESIPATTRLTGWLRRMKSAWCEPAPLSLPDWDLLCAPGLEPLDETGSGQLFSSRQSRGVLERVRFVSAGDRYVAVLRAPGVPRDGLTVTVTRQHATISVRAAPLHTQEGNVVFLSRKAAVRERLQLSFTDPVAACGHSAKLVNGVLTLEFQKEAAAPSWAHSLEVT